MSSLARFNPRAGFVDFWHEFRKPNPWRLPILAVSTVPAVVIFVWLNSETVYKDLERPKIEYVTSLDPDRTDAEIAASNLENQEVKELREAEEARIAERKRDMYKALGAAAGMDVEEIEAEAEAKRAAEEKAEAERRAGLRGTAAKTPQDTTP